MPMNYKMKHLIEKLESEGQLEFEYVKNVYGGRARALCVWSSLIIQKYMDSKGKALPRGDVDGPAVFSTK